MPRRPPARLDQKGLMEYALRTLTMRALSVAELKARLLRRAASPSDVEDVLAKLKEPGFLNDERFAESYATARLENQGFGRMRVLRDLRQRRVSGSVAQRAVDQAFEGTDEPALIRQFIERKYRGKNLSQFLSEDKNLMSAYRRLRAAGFSSGAAIGVLKSYAAQADALYDVGDDEEPAAE